MFECAILVCGAPDYHRCVGKFNSVASTFGKYTCVDLPRLCTGITECLDGSDETSAICTCTGTVCQLTDKCIVEYSGLLCNGVNDCGDPRDWTDECECNYDGYEARYCFNSGRCLVPWQICDGIDDCGDGSDEAGCTVDFSFCNKYNPSGEFSCATYTTNDRCVPLSRVCDGFADCSDGSDESFCQTQCPAGELRYLIAIIKALWWSYEWNYEC